MEISKEEVPLKENAGQEEEELITDFSQMFKGKGFAKRMPKLSSAKQPDAPNWLLQIPAKIQLTKQQLQQRRAMDQRRWHALAKTSEQQWQTLAAAVSAWNYLYSSKGAGQLPQLTVKKAAQILKQQNISFEDAPEEHRAKTVMACFGCLCSKLQVKGSAKVIFKPSLPNKVDLPEQGVKALLEGLKDYSRAYVLVTSDKVLCPVGFEYTPLVPIDAYKKLEDINPEKTELWIITSALKRFDPSFVIKRWKHVLESLEVQWPMYLDLDEPKKGPIRHPGATTENQSEERGNYGCWVELVRVE